MTKVGQNTKHLQKNWKKNRRGEAENPFAKWSAQWQGVRCNKNGPGVFLWWHIWNSRYKSQLYRGWCRRSVASEQCQCARSYSEMAKMRCWLLDYFSFCHLTKAKTRIILTFRKSGCQIHLIDSLPMSPGGQVCSGMGVDFWSTTMSSMLQTLRFFLCFCFCQSFVSAKVQKTSNQVFGILERTLSKLWCGNTRRAKQAGSWPFRMEIQPLC